LEVGLRLNLLGKFTALSLSLLGFTTGFSCGVSGGEGKEGKRGRRNEGEDSRDWKRKEWDTATFCKQIAATDKQYNLVLAKWR